MELDALTPEAQGQFQRYAPSRASSHKAPLEAIHHKGKQGAQLDVTAGAGARLAPLNTKAAALRRCTREKGLPLAGALAGSEQGVVDVHSGLAAPQRHALPHLHRFLPVARIAAAVSHVPVSYALIFRALSPSDPFLRVPPSHCWILHCGGWPAISQQA